MDARRSGCEWPGLVVGGLLVGAALGGSGVASGQEELFVTNNVNSASYSVRVYARTASGNVAPLRTLRGAATLLFNPVGTVDLVHDELVVANADNAIRVFPRTASGNVPPLRTLQGAATGLNGPIGVFVDLVHNELVVTNTDPANFGINSSITVYPRTASGNVLPLRTLQGAATGLDLPGSVVVDLVRNELVVTSYALPFARNGSVTVYPRTASGNLPPLRTLAGAATGVVNPIGVAVDLVHGELVVANTAGNVMNNGSVTVFPRTASGNVAPSRTLAGAATGFISPEAVIVDLVHDELVVTNADNAIRVFPRTASGNTAPLRTVTGGLTGLSGPISAALATSPPLLAAVLPVSRSVQVGTPATAFAAIINAGPGPAQACAPIPRSLIPATYGFHTTNAQNQLVGPPNTPATIAAGATQNYLFVFTPTAPFAATDVQLGFACESVNRAAVISGLNTLLLSASTTPVPDVIAVAATLLNNGIVDVPGPTGTGLFAIGSSNVGITGTITVSADTNGVVLPLLLNVCETNTGTGACLAFPTPTVTVSYLGGTNRSFAVFAQGTGGIIPFDPATSRVFARFKEGAVTRGATSVAVRTQ